MASSIFDSFDAPRPKPVGMAGGGTHAEEKKEVEDKPEEKEEEKDPPLRIPTLWAEWRSSVLVASTARRFLRELARIISRFEGDALHPPMALFRRHVHPLVPSGAGHVLQYHCQGDAVLSSAERKLGELCEESGGLDAGTVVREALLALSCDSGGASGRSPRRIVFTVLLHCLAGRSDLAEDMVRDAAQEVLSHCESFAFAYDDLSEQRRTRFHASSQYVRRQVTVMSWQLELCLWLHRGGTFALSGLAAKEATAAVRIGLVVASWGRNHETFEKLLRCEPDCAVDHEVGRQLWSSMKMITGYHDDKAVKGVGPGSGGWEFLVDCRRDSATAMLRDRKPGSFLIRPHAEDHGVFTLSFRTNLVPNIDAGDRAAAESLTPRSGNQTANTSGGAPSPANASSGGTPGPSTPATAKTPTDAAKGTNTNAQRPVKRDDVVQHAIVRLSDAGFRCGSFGPFTSLMKLLEAISNSLPFSLLFAEPPVRGIIKEQGASPSPNSFFLRKMSLHSKSNHFKWNTETQGGRARTQSDNLGETEVVQEDGPTHQADGAETESEARRRFGMFSQLLALSEVRKQVSAIAAAEFDESPIGESSSWQDPVGQGGAEAVTQENLGDIDDFDGSLSGSEEELGEEEMYAVASRMLRPLLSWCRSMEVAIVHDLAPSLAYVSQGLATMPVDVAASETAIEIAPSDIGSCIDGGDALIRHMIQPGSGVEFRTLRLGEGGQSAIVVLFSKKEAITWLVSTGAEKDEADAIARLRIMERRRVIEQIDVNELAVGKSYSTSDKGRAEQDIRYRFVDPWEVEVVESKEGEVAGASLGRGHYLSFNVGIVARSCEQVQRSLGGLHLLGLWSLGKGGLFLTKALASVHPPWERSAGGDLLMKEGAVAEPPPYTNSMRQHLYRNILFRRLRAPQRFMALIQVELLDLKNLTSPSGTHTLTAYALLRLKRPGSGAPLTHKARTLDSAATQPKKISKSSGPNAPASWGSLVRFRFPLPEDVNCDGVSFDGDKEALFKGAPSVLQISVYEKKFMSDSTLGGADVKLDALSSGGQLEEWVPLRAPHEKGGITWFARIRLTLRFELMCLETDEAEVEASMNSERCPSVGLRRIKQLSRLGGAHEDTKQVIKKSVSTPDLITYLESMVY
eukprot:CAMPEP_0113586586 /NCGR_PEP_ID=MMETSP0015_2-20120614/34380_1 /TAXON_ID=2838 /ORGANISM="Odontella" /LENGTH=1137 /DNA_ID=CAMNT_0000492041 /DNA_START=15 /DNA_END=3428 /DNA_ORIENTATION=- /assembly_acc=CAM_ASM_000160